MLIRFSCLLSALSLLLLTGGCAEESSPPPLTLDEMGHGNLHHVHGDSGHAMALGEALEHLEEMTEDIASAFAEGDTDAAHGPLHQIGHLIEAFAKSADQSELPDEARTTIKTNVEALMNAFGAVDRQLHGQEGSDFADVKEEIEAAMTAIHEAAEPALGDHDHDEEEHGAEEHGEHEEDADHDHEEESPEEHEEEHGDAEHSEKE